MTRMAYRPTRLFFTLSTIIWLLLVAPILLLTPAQAANLRAKTGKTSPLPLPPGSVLTGTIGQGDLHSFVLSVKTDQFLQITVEQQGADIALMLYDCNGQKIISVNNALTIRGQETISLIANQSGLFRIEILIPLKISSPGAYTLTLSDTRVATAKDRRRLLADYAVAEGLGLEQREDSHHRSLALTKFETALTIYRAEGDLSNQARTLNKIALLHRQLYRSEQAHTLFAESLQLSRRASDRFAQSDALIGLGLAELSASELPNAWRYLREAEALKNALDDEVGLARIFSYFGSTARMASDYQRALDYFKQSLMRFRALNSFNEIVSVLTQIGITHTTLGDPKQAIDYFQEARNLNQHLNNRKDEGWLLNKIGEANYAQSNYVAALDAYRRALPLIRESGDITCEAVIYANFGTSKMELGNYSEAIEDLEQSLKLFREVRNISAEANTLAKMGRVYSKVGELQKARDVCALALRLLRESGKLQGESLILYSLAMIERDHGNYAIALDIMAEALQAVETTRAMLTNHHLRTSYSSRVRNYYDTYVDILMQLDKESPAGQHAHSAFRACELNRARILNEILDEAHADIHSNSDPNLLAAEQALQEKLNVKANALLRAQIQKADNEITQALRREINELTIAYHEVQAQISAASTRRLSLAQPATLTLQEIQERILDDDTLLLEYTLGKQRSYLWVISKTTVNTFELTSRQIIEPLALQVSELLTARNKIVRFETPGERSERIRVADAEFLQTARQLRDLIIQPAAAYLTKKRLLIVSDRALHYIPFAALPSVKESPSAQLYRPLILDFEIVNLPSATTLAKLRQETAGRTVAPKTLAIFADPVFRREDKRLKAMSSPLSRHNKTVSLRRVALELDSSFDCSHAETRAASDEFERIARLPFTRSEAEAIAAMVPNEMKKVALGFDANRENALRQELSQYRYLHFATHSWIDSSHPELSSIILSTVNEQGEERNGFLRAHEIFRLHLPAELVVLSGCQTGLGKDVKSEGLIGLTRSFMYAGAVRVLVSLWDVNDESTAELMARFYQRTLGAEQLSPAAALRAAQVSMLHDQRWNAPYYWAAFVLQGEYK